MAAKEQELEDAVLANLVCLPKVTLDAIKALKDRLPTAITWAQTSPHFRAEFLKGSKEDIGIHHMLSEGQKYNYYRDPKIFSTRKDNDVEGLFLGNIPILVRGEARQVPVYFSAFEVDDDGSRGARGTYNAATRRIDFYYHAPHAYLSDEKFLRMFFATIEHEGVHARDYMSRPGDEYDAVKMRWSKLSRIIETSADYAMNKYEHLPMGKRASETAKKLLTYPNIVRMLRARNLKTSEERYNFLKIKIFTAINSRALRDERANNVTEYFNSEHELAAHSCNIATEVIAALRERRKADMLAVIAGSKNVGELISEAIEANPRYRSMKKVLYEENKRKVYESVGKRVYKALFDKVYTPAEVAAAKRERAYLEMRDKMRGFRDAVRLYRERRGDLKQLLKDDVVLKAATDFRTASERLDAFDGGKRYARAAAQDIGKTAAYLSRVEPVLKPLVVGENEKRLAALLFGPDQGKGKVSREVVRIQNDQAIDTWAERAGHVHVTRRR